MTIDLDEAKRLCEQVSGGTWTPRYEPAGRHGGGNEWHIDSDLPKVGCVTCGLSDGTPQSEADARFLAAARQLVPALITEVERLTKEVVSLQVQLLERAPVIKAAKESASALRLGEQSAWEATDAALCKAVDDLAHVEYRRLLANEEPTDA